MKSYDRERILAWIRAFSGPRIISPLFSFLPSTDPLVKWRAVEGLGLAVSRMAEEDLEAARVVMRRLMWHLNDESGGIGWGCPEAMGEIMAQSRPLALEYAHVLRSYVDEEANYIEYEPLQEGVLWALGRLAGQRADLVEEAAVHITAFLRSPRSALRGLALWCLGSLREIGTVEIRRSAASMVEDQSEVDIYIDGQVRIIKIGQLAKGLTDSDRPARH